MNRFNFNRTGGFPFELDSLDEMYKSFNILNSIGELSGDKTIVKGCVTNGSNVSDGIVYVNGEMLEFKGGAKLSTVKIFEQPIKKTFENGSEVEVFYHRWVGFGSGEGAMNWADFKLVISLRELQGRLLPPGTNPQMYTGSINDIPDGWHLCDGQNGTPDLRKRFIVGYDPTDPDYNAIGKTGGLKEVALTEEEGPVHNHTGETDWDGEHDHDIAVKLYNENGAPASKGSGEIASGGPEYENYSTWTTKKHYGHTHEFTTDNAGDGVPHENRPPYFTLAFIIYTGQ